MPKGAAKTPDAAYQARRRRPHPQALVDDGLCAGQGSVYGLEIGWKYMVCPSLPSAGDVEPMARDGKEGGTASWI